VKKKGSKYVFFVEEYIGLITIHLNNRRKHHSDDTSYFTFKELTARK
jgi:hypothetical protein